MYLGAPPGACTLVLPAFALTFSPLQHLLQNKHARCTVGWLCMLCLVPKNDVHWQKQIMMIMSLVFPIFLLHLLHVFVDAEVSSCLRSLDQWIRLGPWVWSIWSVASHPSDIRGALQAQSTDSWRHLLLGKNGCMLQLPYDTLLRSNKNRTNNWKMKECWKLKCLAALAIPSAWMSPCLPLCAYVYRDKDAQ